MANGNGKHPEIECDFSKVPRRWGVRWAQIQNDVPLLMQIIQAPIKDGLSDDELLTVNQGKAEAHEKMNGLIDESTQLMAKVLVDVPREWLIASAPDVIDWSNPENLLDWVREDMTTQLVLSVSIARNDAAKNSLTLMPSNGSTPVRQ